MTDYDGKDRPEHYELPDGDERTELRNGIVRALYALPMHFTSPINVEGIEVNDLFSINTLLGGTIEAQTVMLLNSLRSIWDPQGKSLERDVMECLVAAKSQVVMFPHALTALKLHCRTDIDGYPAMHKAPPRQFMPGRGCIYQFLKSFWLPTRTIANPRRPVSSPAAAPTIKQISNGFICTPIDRVA